MIDMGASEKKIAYEDAAEAARINRKHPCLNGTTMKGLQFAHHVICLHLCPYRIEHLRITFERCSTTHFELIALTNTYACGVIHHALL